MKIVRKTAIRYLRIHAALLTALLLFPLYRLLADRLTDAITGCFLHDRLFLYCSFCGGTRALSALLRFDLPRALALNPLVVFLVLAAIGLDIFALVRLLKGKARLLPIPWWWIIILLGVIFGYGILRNYLMIAHGYDPTGDLGVFWNR